MILIHNNFGNLHRGYVLEPGFLVVTVVLFPKWFKQAVVQRKSKNLRVTWMAGTYKKAVDAVKFLMMVFGEKQGIVLVE